MKMGWSGIYRNHTIGSPILYRSIMKIDICKYTRLVKSVISEPLHKRNQRNRGIVVTN